MSRWPTWARYVGITAGRGAGGADRPAFREALLRLPVPSVVIVGACVGGDMEAAIVATGMGHWVHAVVPADRSRVDPRWGEWCQSFELMQPGTDYRARNERIVEFATDALMAFPEHPEGDPRSRRSGTWMTIRIAMRAGLPVELFVLRQ